MKKNQGLRNGLVLGSVALSFAAVACGGGPSGAGGYRDIGALKNAMESPTGTVEPTSAVGVAEAFETSNSAPLGGIRQKAQAQSATIACTEGGNASASANGNNIYFTYNNCAESGCTMNGSGAMMVESDGLSQCMSYDISAVCADVGSVEMSFSGCFSAEGDFSYLIEFEGETFRVSGSYAGGNGELSISGENGTYTCTYTGGTGTCSGSAGDSFSF
jgi:hypothetical protein